VRISRLELHGFKSFPDRTTFHFGRGVSCVVGPNGCGKSNVVDALRWCIGEQSPRSLRGSEMADVIFAGSQDRRPVGYAEVQLSLVADGEPFPGDYAAVEELQVGRRLHRSGTSEYLINQNRVRRRDVVELLLDSGIGNNLYSFIEQGQVDKVITATPEERRSVIDEAAGIARYKARRQEARSRLDATASQLDRATDVVDEMSRRLRSLERQVVRAARFRALRAQIRQAEIQLALAKVQALTAERRGRTDQLRTVRASEAAQRREVVRQDADLAQRRGALEVAEAAATTHRDAVADLDAALREHDATRRLLNRRLQELEAAGTAAGSEVQRSTVQVEQAEREQEAAVALQTERQSALQTQSEAQREREEHVSAARGRVEETQRAGMALGAERAGVEAQISAAAERQRGTEAAAAEREQRLAVLAADRAAVVAAQPEAEADGRRAREAVARAEAQCSGAAAARSAAEMAFDAASAAVEAARAAAALARAEAARREQQVRRRGQEWVAAARTRAEAQVEATDAYWAAEHAAQVATAGATVERAAAQTARRATERDALRAQAATLDEALQVAEARRAGVQARLRPDTEVVPGAERLLDGVAADQRGRAIEALGEDALLPVVRRAQAVPEGAEGKVWFLPEGTPAALDATRFAGWPAALAAAAKDGRPVSAPGLRFAHGLLVLGDQDGARAVEEEARLTAEIAEHTAAREALDPSLAAADAASQAVAEAERAARVAWSEAQRGEALRARRKAEVAAARSATAEAVGALQSEVDSVVERLAAGTGDGPSGEEHDAARATALVVRDEAQERHASLRLELERARQDAARSEAAHEALQARAGSLAAEVAAVAERAEEQRATVAAAAAALEDHTATLQAVTARQAAAAAEADSLRAALGEAERVLAVGQERLSSAREAAAAAVARVSSGDARLIASREALAGARSRATLAETDHVRITGERDAAILSLERATLARAAAWDRLEVARGQVRVLKESLGAADAAVNALRETVDALAREADRYGAEIARLNAELEGIRTRMDERYQASVYGLLEALHAQGTLRLDVDPDVATGLQVGTEEVDPVGAVHVTPDVLTDEARVVALVEEVRVNRTKLDSLGEVNLAALEEFHEVVERHGQLLTQREDLEESVRSIRGAIAKLNRLCRERFKEAFDQVNEHFQEVYPRLVGGGSARLSLTDKEDILEAGVDIFVQPPGKRLQNLGLLSGGEKAMTAIALLIALFRVKPSPFCVLDEVDAPLDEANGARFNDMLREMSLGSQFLVITHNRKTMECADTLYGITMAKPGVSRLVSVEI